MHGDIGASNITSHEGAAIRNSAFNMVYIDHPSSTSSETYRVRFVSNGSDSLSLGNHGGSPTILYAIELDGGIF